MSTEKLVGILSDKVKEFYLDHGIYPNAILLSVNDIISLGEVDKVALKQKLPTITSLIPLEAATLYDLPMPVLLPIVATNQQREQAIFLESRDL